MSTETPPTQGPTTALEKTADSGLFVEIEQRGEAITKKASDIIAGKYELNEVIGRGGMGKIYKATQLKLNRTVAVKVMLAPEDITATQRFEAEASVTANLTHPNTVRIFDFGTTEDGFLFLVMEHLDGVDIKNYLKTNGVFPPLLAAKLISEICGSLAEAHRKEIIHRDIKPGNIMLISSPEEGLRSKLLDFGLVKSLEGDSSRTQTGIILGSPMYMSPEQIDGEQIGPRSDLYSLGLTLYHMLTASKPFQEANLSGILAAQLFKQPPPAESVNATLTEYPTLLWIMTTAIQKRPEDRFQSASQMKRALDLFLLDPQSALALQDGKLYHNGVVVDEQASAGMSLHGSLLANQNNDASVATQTLYHPPPVEEAPKSYLGAVIAFLIVCAIAATVYALSDATSPPTETTIAPSSTTDLSTKQAPDAETKAPTVAVPTVRLDTIPSGATAFAENGEQLSVTPFSLPASKEMEITFKLDGYEDQTITVSGDLPERTIQLNAIVPKKKSPKVKKNPPSVKKNTTSPKPDDDLRSLSSPVKK